MATTTLARALPVPERISYDADRPPAISNDNLRPYRILLVEDLVADARLVRHALDASGIPHELTVLSKGDDVLPYLRQARQFYAFPDLVMLDLGLPGTNGFDVLDQLLHEPAAVRCIPIAILTGMLNFNYIVGHYGQNLVITSYLEKPCAPSVLRTSLHKALSLRTHPSRDPQGRAS